LPSHKDCLKSKRIFAEFFKIIDKYSRIKHNQRIVEPHNEKLVIVNPPNNFMSEEDLDFVYDLPYTRLPHVRYLKKPSIPAFEMIKDSVTIHRGCFGGCSFCAITAHQGKFVFSRSEDSILNEIKTIAKSENFKGHISDLGGPSANMYRMKGIDELQCNKCQRSSCLYPNICKNLCFNHKYLIDLYNNAKNIDGIKKLTIGSGIRYDMLVDIYPELDKKYEISKYVKLLIENHVSGRLKVAPEHTEEKVLNLMRKSSFSKFRAFNKLFNKINYEKNLKQELVLYLISGHPGCDENDMDMLAKSTKAMGYRVETVQEFTPTPMTMSSVMYYTNIDPYTMNPLFVAKSNKDKFKQKMKVVKYKK
jgi:uncharacterized radical SAM protein YgiQ